MVESIKNMTMPLGERIEKIKSNLATTRFKPTAFFDNIKKTSYIFFFISFRNAVPSSLTYPAAIILSKKVALKILQVNLKDFLDSMLKNILH